MKAQTPSLFSIPNVRRFIWFRLFFNARFYYPVFTILFLDFGLTLSQFAVLNAVWAGTIVLLEVPSGALADTLGRKKLLVAAAGIMAAEMGVLLIAPRGNPDWLFIFFVVNRILSGTAEASASGADEALAYDALKAHGKESQWGRVLESAMRLQSIGFMATMSIGAAVYDPELVQWIVDILDLKIRITGEMTLRFPILLTFFMALLALATTIGMEETAPQKEACEAGKGCTRSIFEAFRLTGQAGKWILKTPFALVVIATGFLFDGMLRMVVTMTSQYYRLIRLPEASFGLIGSALSLLGLFIPRLAMGMSRRYSPARNMVATAGVTLAAFAGMALFVPYAGLIPVVALFTAMFMTGFFVSHYLNRITPSVHRATVLSFKGLSFNLAYGGIGLMYSLLLALLREGIRETGVSLTGEALKNTVFIQSMAYFPLFFIPAVGVLMFWARYRLRDAQDHRNPG